MPPYPTALQDYPVLRQSTLASFDSCPLTWDFDRRFAKHWSFPPSARGILWHRFQAKCFLTMADQHEERIEVDVALAILHETLRQADVPIEEWSPCPSFEIADMYWMAKKFASEMTWNIDGLVSVEERLATVLEYPDPDGGTVGRHFSGQPDVLFVEGEFLEHAIVLDAKTGWWLPPPSEISEQGFFQQKGYALLVFDWSQTITSVTLREFYPRYSQNREATLYRDQVDDLRLEMAEVAEQFDRAYEAQRYKPVPGKHCSYCSHPSGCPIFPKAKKVGMIRSNEEAMKILDEVLVAEAWIKQGKDALKAWTATHGAVPVKDAKADRVYGHRSYQRTARPTREQAERALQMGESVDDLYRTEIHTRFDVHIPKPELTPDDDELIKQLEASLAQVEDRKKE